MQDIIEIKVCSTFGFARLQYKDDYIDVASGNDFSENLDKAKKELIKRNNLINYKEISGEL